MTYPDLWHRHQCRAGCDSAALQGHYSCIVSFFIFVVIAVGVSVGVAVAAAALRAVVAVHDNTQDVGVDGLQVLFAELGTLDGGDTGAHDQQHAVCHAAEDRSVGDEADGRGIHDNIVECLLQGGKDLLGHGGGEQLGGVRRDRTGGQDRDAGILDADKRRGQRAFILGGDDVRQNVDIIADKEAVDRQLSFFQQELHEDLIRLEQINNNSHMPHADIAAKAITQLVFNMGAKVIDLSAEQRIEVAEQTMLMIRMILTGARHLTEEPL